MLNLAKKPKVCYNINIKNKIKNYGYSRTPDKKFQMD